jgi:predicted permease
MWGWRWLENLGQDLRYAARTLRNSAGFSTVAVLTLALGIGANTTIFSVLNAVLLRDLPVDDPGRLVSFAPENSFSYPDYLDFRGQSSSFEGVCALYPNVVASLSGGDTPDRVLGEVVTANYFSVVGIRPALGRGFVPDEDSMASPVVVLSHALWRRNFGAEPGILGKTVRMNGRGYTVVGIAPEGFHGTRRGFAADFWAPVSMADYIMPWAAEAKLLATRDQRGFVLLARLKRGFKREQAVADVGVISERIRRMSGLQPGKTVSLEMAGALGGPRAQQIVSWATALMAVVALLLLIACANVANLQLARATSRRREIGIRLAIGAGRSRIVRQLLTESVLLSAVGATLGFALAAAATHSLSRLELPSRESITLDVSPDGRVLLFTALLAIGTAIAFGLAPALEATRHDPIRGLKEEASRTTATGSGLRSVLVATQVALSVMLVAGAGLFLRSLWKTLAVDPGFRPDHVLVLNLDPRKQGYSKDDTIRLFRSIEERLAALPGVRSTSFVSIVPLSNFRSGRGFRADRQRDDKTRQANVLVVSAGYFETLGIPLLRGRSFERARTDPQAVVSETAARLFFPGEDPIGRRILTYDRKRAYEVMGVVPDAKLATITEAPAPCLYQLFDQEPGSAVYGMAFLIRTEIDPQAMIKPARDQIAALDRDLAVQGVETMQAHVQKALFGSRLSATLFGAFGVLGLAIAAVGLYGLMSYTVRCRTKEIAIRAALGASPIDLARTVTAQGMALVSFGIVAGLAAALAASRLVSSFLYGITATDAATFLAAPAVLLVAALAATAIPARRATHIDPMEALRYE